jgi:hypothetical protein
MFVEQVFVALQHDHPLWQKKSNHFPLKLKSLFRLSEKQTS